VAVARDWAGSASLSSVTGMAHTCGMLTVPVWGWLMM